MPHDRIWSLEHHVGDLITEIGKLGGARSLTDRLEDLEAKFIELQEICTRLTRRLDDARLGTWENHIYALQQTCNKLGDRLDKADTFESLLSGATDPSSGAIDTSSGATHTWSLPDVMQL
jgi:hypothetical protein